MMIRLKNPWMIGIIVITMVLAVYASGFFRLRQWQQGSIVTDPAKQQESQRDSDGGSENSDWKMHEFTGHSRCADCHSEIAAIHQTMPHAHTMAVTGESEYAKRLCGVTRSGGAEFGTYHYSCDEEGLTAELPDLFPGRLFPLDYAFGSGKHAVTFLTLLNEGDETVSVEHRLSWYHHLDGLDVTPGQQDETPQRSMEYFGKVFRGEDMHRCVNCHVTTGRVHDGAIHDLTPGVHCEKCHGPGARHVSAAESGDTSLAVSSIEGRWNALDQITMCGECHRLPEDIDPERLRLYPDSLIRFQPVGLLQSRCYSQSEGKLSCTTCHDPHAPVESRTPVMQENSCRSCHQPESETACRANHVSDCISCHMPPVELVPGISFHDHWIRVRDSKAEESDHPTTRPKPEIPKH